MSWVEKVQVRLPNLRAKSYFFTHGNILIDDTGCEDAGNLLATLGYSVPMQILDAQQLSKELNELVDVSEFAAAVLPGNGSIEVWKRLECTIPAIKVTSSRKGYRNPQPVVEDFSLSASPVVVIDDVVSTGETARVVFDKGIRQPATLCTWVLQYPRDNRLRVYNAIAAVLVVAGEKGKVPVNSISTFLRNPDIAKSYAMRFCKNAADFFSALELIEEEVKHEV